jgi:dipeptidyl-peptidase-4
VWLGGVWGAGAAPHAVIPLTGATHMAANGLAEQLLRLELDFIRRCVGS